MSWQRVRGHDRLIKAFDFAVRRGRLAHAYLFAGPEGVGKRLFAQELAKALLCEAPPGDALEACDRCPACLQVDAGSHPDLAAAGRPEDSLEVGIDVVRELCRALSLKPARGRYKLAILDDADDLNDESANCFLKTLEEPPPNSVLILIGKSAEGQLPTVVSRCQVIRFSPLPEELVRELLSAQVAGDPSLVDRLARMSGGSPGQARVLADPELWDFRRELLEALTRTPIPTVELVQKWTRFLDEAGKESGAQRRRASQVVRLLVEFLTDALRQSVGGALRSTEDQALLNKLTKNAPPEQLIEALERSLQGDYHIDRRVQLVLAIEALVDDLGRVLGRGQGAGAGA